MVVVKSRVIFSVVSGCLLARIQDLYGFKYLRDKTFTVARRISRCQRRDDTVKTLAITCGPSCRNSLERCQYRMILLGWVHGNGRR